MHQKLPCWVEKLKKTSGRGTSPPRPLPTVRRGLEGTPSPCAHPLAPCLMQPPSQILLKKALIVSYCNWHLNTCVTCHEVHLSLSVLLLLLMFKYFIRMDVLNTFIMLWSRSLNESKDSAVTVSSCILFQSTIICQVLFWLFGNISLFCYANVFLC